MSPPATIFAYAGGPPAGPPPRAVRGRDQRADGRAAGGLGEPLHHVVVHRLVRDHAAGRCAVLAGVVERGERHLLDGRVEIGVRADHYGRVAAEFEMNPGEPIRRRPCDGVARPR
jgi:hypothetical protein